jgi:glycoprotease/Kae1 family metallohydrolase
MFYLAIETSCDETSLAILKVEEPLQLHETNFYNKINQIQVISSIISSQIETHAQYGGVVPEVGARLHAEQIHGLFKIVLKEALEMLKIGEVEFYKELNTIFVTAEPGLMSALRVGIEFAKSLQFYISKKFEKQIELEFVNHLQGHTASCFYEMKQKENQKVISHKKAEVGNSPREGWQSQTDGVFQNDAANYPVASQQPLVPKIPQGNLALTGSLDSVNTQIEINYKLAKKNQIQNSHCQGGGRQRLTGVISSDAANNGDTVVAATDQPDLSHTGTGSFAPPKMTDHLDNQIFPHLHLMISGGNTQIRLLSSWQDWQIMGQTIDDAAGECFDKAARMVGIPYPGGATLSKIAGDHYSNPLSLPIAMLQSHDLNISLSGLKTAVRYKIQKADIPNLNLDESLSVDEIELLKTQDDFPNNPKLQFVKEICISTQFAIVEQIVRKIDLAIKQYQPNSIGISGGVSANRVLINKIQALKSAQSLAIPKIFAPDPSLTGDNAIMIGLAGLMKN